VPRRRRLILQNLPHHIVQRGHNRNVVFVENADYEYYLNNLIEWKLQLDIDVYSYCLMTNHVHLIVNPGETPENVSELMKRLAGRQTRYVNRLENRTGTLWDSRYRISPIDTDEYLLQCCRYVELNPVKAKMCMHAEQYRWSSYQAKLGLVDARWLDEDPSFESLGDSIRQCRKNYKAYVEDWVGAQVSQQFIQIAVDRNQLTGSTLFTDQIESRTGVRIEYRGRGRPAKEHE